MMKAYYIISSLFFILLFPRLLTDVICFGKYRDQLFVKSKKEYFLIYSCWTIVFCVSCLFMGSIAGVDYTFDKIHDCYILYLTECDYTYNRATETKNIKEEDFVLEYYVKRNEDNMNDLIVQIIKDNNSLYKRYHLNNLEVRAFLNSSSYGIYNGEEMIATASAKKEGLLKKVTFQWNRLMLEKIREESGG